MSEKPRKDLAERKSKEVEVERMKMSLNEWEYPESSNEVQWETNSFHTTNPFASDIEDWHRISILVESTPTNTTADIFLYDEMSHNISNAEQNLRIVQANQQIPRQHHQIAPKLPTTLPETPTMYGPL